MTDTEKEAKRRPLYVWVLIILVFTLAISALISGVMLFAAPKGNAMGMSIDLLNGSPFNDFLGPGIILFLFVGVFPFIVGLGLVNTSLKWLKSLNPFRNHYWAWTGAITVGIILLIWIIVETIMVGYISFLQPVMGVWGALIITLTMLPAVRRYYRVATIQFNPNKKF